MTSDIKKRLAEHSCLDYEHSDVFDTELCTDAIQRIEELEKMAVKTVSAFDHMLDEKDRRIEELEEWNKIDETESDKLRNRIEELDLELGECDDKNDELRLKIKQMEGAGNDYRECLQRIQNTLQEYQDRGVAPYASVIQMIIDEIQRSFDRYRR